MRWVRLIEVGRVISFVYLGLGPFEMRVQRRKLLVWWELWEVGDRLRVMRGGWLLNTQVQRRELLLVGWELWEVGEFNISGVRVGWVLRHEGEHREERRDEIEERRQNEKKSWSAVRKKMGFLWKKLTKEGSYIYEVAIKNGCFVFKITSTHILKHTVKTMVFQQYFPNNSCLNPLTKHLFFLFGH